MTAITNRSKLIIMAPAVFPTRLRVVSAAANQGVNKLTVSYAPGSSHDSPGHPECAARGPAAERGAKSITEDALRFLETKQASLDEASVLHSRECVRELHQAIIHMDLWRPLRKGG